MNDMIIEMVDRMIVHAQTMLNSGAYDWPTSRTALERILIDLEARTLGHPGLGRLRQFIALGDEKWQLHQGETKCR